MYRDKMYEEMKNKFALIKVNIGNELDTSEYVAGLLEDRRSELRAKMQHVLEVEAVMEQSEYPKADKKEVIVGLVCEPGIDPEAMVMDELENNYIDKNFDEVCFTAGDGIIVMYDEDDIAEEDDISYLCGPMFIVGIDEFGNIKLVNSESIKEALDFLEMNTVKMKAPDDESLEYSVFRLD